MNNTSGQSAERLTGQAARLEYRGQLAVVTMDDPQTANANSTPQMVEGLVSVFERIRDDNVARVMILTGAGRSFSSGGEFKLMEAFQSMSAMEVQDYYVRRGIQRLTRAMVAIDIPTIAAVNGGAFGSGFGAALMFDFRLASTAASFTMNFSKIGLLPGDGGAWFLTRLLGPQAAAEILYLGDTIDAARAKQIGLVLDVVQPEDLMPAALSLAERISARPAANMKLMKRLLRHAQTSDLGSFLDMTVSMQALSHHTAEHRDELNALKEKLTRKKSGGAKQGNAADSSA